MKLLSKSQVLSVLAMSALLSGAGGVAWADTASDNAKLDKIAKCQQDVNNYWLKAQIQGNSDIAAKRILYQKCQYDADNSTSTNSNVDTSGPCGHANLFGKVKGDNCQKAADAVENVQARDKAVNMTTMMVTQGAASLATNSAAKSSANDAAQKAQASMLRTTAIAKLLQAAEQGYSAMQLNGAADDANLANKNLKTAATSNVQPACAGDNANDTSCQTALANLSTTRVANENYGYVNRGAIEAKTQADAASSASTTAMLGAAVSGLTGMIMLNEANKANQNANLAPSLSYGLAPSMVTGSTPAVGGAAAPNGAPNSANMADASLPNLGAGGIQGGLAPNQSPLTTPTGTTPAKSEITASSGGGLGGGGPDPSAGKNGKTDQRKRLLDTGLGSIGDGGGSAFRGGGGLGLKDNGADTALTDAIKKLLNPDGTEKKDEARSLASVGQGNGGSEADSFALPADVSIFQQVTAKYHQLNTNGSI